MFILLFFCNHEQNSFSNFPEQANTDDAVLGWFFRMMRPSSHTYQAIFCFPPLVNVFLCSIYPLTSYVLFGTAFTGALFLVLSLQSSF